MYKVVSYNKRSAIVIGAASVRYYHDRWAKAPKWLRDKGYGLLVFKTLIAARSFIPGSIIYKCHIRKQEKELPQMMKYCLLSNKNICIDGDWPEGTVMVDKVKLVGGRL